MIKRQEESASAFVARKTDSLEQLIEEKHALTRPGVLFGINREESTFRNPALVDVWANEIEAGIAAEKIRLKRYYDRAWERGCFLENVPGAESERTWRLESEQRAKTLRSLLCPT